jgi:hypothetical protein
VREFGVKVGCTLAGRAAFKAVTAAGPVGVGLATAVTLAGLGYCVWRASQLMTQAVYGSPEAVPLRARTAAMLVPGGLVFAALASRPNLVAFQLATATYLGKLTERALRDTVDTHLAHVLPAAEVVDAHGTPLTRDALDPIHMGRTQLAVGPSLIYHATYELSVHTLQAGPWPMVLGSGAVEAARALTLTLACEVAAGAQGHFLRAKPGGGFAALQSNLGSTAALRQSRDCAAMRAYFGLARDSFDVFVGTPGSTLGRAVAALLRAEIKTTGELRSIAVSRGQLAEVQAGPGTDTEVDDMPPVTFMGECSGVEVPQDEPVVIHILARGQGAPRS